MYFVNKQQCLIFVIYAQTPQRLKEPVFSIFVHIVGYLLLQHLDGKGGVRPKEVSSPPEPKPTVLTATVTVFGCPLCTYTSECRDELDRHLRRLHKMSLHNCEFCNKSFSDKYKLHKHFLSCKWSDMSAD